MATRPQNLGYDSELLILAFDHRGSFQKKMFGIAGAPTPEETQKIASYKEIIFRGFEKALNSGRAPKEAAGVLFDEQFGTAIGAEAKQKGYLYAMPAEKSGQNEFDFEYGPEFGAHIEHFGPTFVKVLVRYNPEGDAEMNKRQAARLKELSDYCHSSSKSKYLFELLVPAEPHQLEKVGGDQKRYDQEVRPGLMIQAIQELQAYGIEPDIWKIEGLDHLKDAQAVAEVCRRDGRDHVSCVVLGRGENDAKVEEWLRVGAQVPAFVGFAIGRSIFWEPLKGALEGKYTREEAADRVADTYARFVKVWKDARG